MGVGSSGGWAAALGAAVLSACAAMPDSGGMIGGKSAYRLQVREDFEGRRFVVDLTNVASVPLCMDGSRWPRGDHLPSEAAASVDDHGQRFKLRFFNFGYPVGLADQIRIKPGKGLSGEISFDQVEDPFLNAPGVDRRLNYAPVFERCDYGRPERKV